MILFKTALKRCIRKPIIIVTILIMPIICLIIDYPFKGSNDVKALNNFTLGVVDKDNSNVSEKFIDKISTQYDVQKIKENEINTLLTNRTCDWVIVVQRGFEDGLKTNRMPLIESYGYAQGEKWIPVKLNIENIVASLGIISGTKDNNEIKKDLEGWFKETRNDNFNFLSRTKGATSPGTGLIVYAIIILFGAYLLSRMFVEDRENELTVRIATSPIPAWKYLLENLACFSVILIIQNILMISAYWVINPQGLVNPILVLCTFMAYSIMAVGLMLTISTLSPTSFVMMCASTGGIMVLSMLGGLFVPVKIMPETMKKIAMITPTYWFTEAVTSIFSASSKFAFQITMLCSFSVVFFLVGSWKKYSKLD